MTIGKKQDEVIAAAKEPGKHGVTFFADILDTEDDPLCRWHAVKAIGDMKGIEAKDQLLSVIREPDYKFDESSLHRICAWAIGRIGHALTSEIIDMLENPISKEMRIALIDSLGEIADPAAIPVLSAQLISLDRDVRLWTALSLAKIGEESLTSLSNALKNADRELVLIITDALAIIATEKTVPVLLQAFDKHSSAVTEYFSKESDERTANYACVIRRSAYISHADKLRHFLEQH